MIATYEPRNPGTVLNVRESPEAYAPVVRTMPAGSERCLSVERGWCRLDGGWADARFLTVTDGGAPEPVRAETADAPSAKPEAKPEPESAPEPSPADDDGRADLMAMTISELRKLAEGSGIEVPKGARKAEIVDIILADDD